MQLLCKYGAELEAKDLIDQTPLSVAAQEGIRPW